MLCQQCGHVLPDGAEFCIECGASIVPVANGESASSAELGSDSKPEEASSELPCPDADQMSREVQEGERLGAADSAVPEPRATGLSVKRPNAVIAGISLAVLVLAAISLFMWWQGSGQKSGWVQVESYTRHYRSGDGSAPVVSLETALPEYDSCGQIVSVRRTTTSSNAESAWASAERILERDSAGRPVTIVREEPTHEAAENEKTSTLVKLAYDGQGNEVSRCTYEPVPGWGHELADFDAAPIISDERCTYDGENHLIERSVAPMAFEEAGQDDIDKTTYVFDELGRTASISVAAGNVEVSHLDFSYNDDLGLVCWEQSIAKANPPSGSAQLDSAGNELFCFGSYEIDADAEVSEGMAVCTVHDAEGRILSEECWSEPDDSGNSELIWMRRYEYDSAGNMVTERFASRDESIVITYGYKDFETGQELAAPSPDEVDDIILDERNCIGPDRAEWHEEDQASCSKAALAFENPAEGDSPAVVAEPTILTGDDASAMQERLLHRRQADALEAFASMLADRFEACNSSYEGHPADLSTDGDNWFWYSYYYAFATGDADGDGLPELILFRNQQANAEAELCGAELYRYDEAQKTVKLVAEPGFIPIVSGVRFFKMGSSGGSIQLSFEGDGMTDQFVLGREWQSGIDGRVAHDYNLVMLYEVQDGIRLAITDMFSADLGERSLSQDEVSYLTRELTGGGEQASQFLPFSAEAIASLSPRQGEQILSQLAEHAKVQEANSFENHPEHVAAVEDALHAQEAAAAAEAEAQAALLAAEGYIGTWGCDGSAGDVAGRFVLNEDGSAFVMFDLLGMEGADGLEDWCEWWVDGDGSARIRSYNLRMDLIIRPASAGYELEVVGPIAMGTYSSPVEYHGTVGG